MSRLFIAVNLSDGLKKTITSSLHDMKKAGIKGSFVPTANLHVTLAFIGETREVTAAGEALRTVKYKPFRLALDQTGCFGDILYVGVKGNQGLTGAARAVRDALSQAGIPFDTKKFEPHVTLIRKVAGNWKQLPPPKGDMMVRSISLMKSEMKDGKRVYTELLSV